MSAERSKIIKEFKRIRALGFVPATRSGDTAIGKTFEDHLGVTENNLKDPDFKGFEVKSQRDLTGSKITLFTKSPTFPKGANTILRQNYGSPDSEFPRIKVLHTSCYSNRFNTHSSGFGFRLFPNDEESRLELQIRRLKDSRILPDQIYWDYDRLRAITARKLDNLFIVYADVRREEAKQYFHFTRSMIFLGFKFESFLEVLREGKVMFDTRIGAYKTPGSKSFGKTHDHGSGFRVDRSSLELLYSHKFDIE